jgi:hypothetical protein
MPRFFSKGVAMMDYCCAMSWTCATCGLNVGLRSQPKRHRRIRPASPFVDWGLFVTLIAATVPGYRFLIFLVTLYFT